MSGLGCRQRFVELGRLSLFGSDGTNPHSDYVNSSSYRLLFLGGYFLRALDQGASRGRVWSIKPHTGFGIDAEL
jgi:hypothetical protein